MRNYGQVRQAMVMIFLPLTQEQIRGRRLWRREFDQSSFSPLDEDPDRGPSAYSKDTSRVCQKKGCSCNRENQEISVALRPFLVPIDITKDFQANVADLNAPIEQIWKR